MAKTKATVSFDVHAYLLKRIPEVLAMFDNTLTFARLAGNLGDPTNTGFMLAESAVDAALQELASAGKVEVSKRAGRRVTLLPPAEKPADEVLDSAPVMTLAPTKAPHEIAAENFFEANRRLQIVVETYGNATIDCSTPAGDKAARDARHKLLKLRTNTDRLRLDSNASHKAVIDANNEMGKAIAIALAPLEARFDKAIKDREAEVEAEKLAKQEEAAKAEQALADKVQEIRDCLVDTTDLTADAIQMAHDALATLEITTEGYRHKFGEAIAAKDYAMRKLQEAANAKADLERREEELRIADEKRAAEDGARKAMQDMRDLAAQAIGATATRIKELLDQVARFDAAAFEPLTDDGIMLRGMLSSQLHDQWVTAVKAEYAETERQDAERERVVNQARADYVRTSISAVNDYAMEGATADSAGIDYLVQDVQAMTLTHDGLTTEQCAAFDAAKTRALAVLANMKTAALAAEKLASEQAEATRLSEEQAETDRKAREEATAKNNAITDLANKFSEAGAIHRGKSAAWLRAKLEELNAVDIDKEFLGERFAEVDAIHTAALDALRDQIDESAHNERIAKERADADAEEERRHLARTARERRAAERGVALVDAIRELDACLLSFGTNSDGDGIVRVSIHESDDQTALFAAWKKAVLLVRAVDDGND